MLRSEVSSIFKVCAKVETTERKDIFLHQTYKIFLAWAIDQDNASKRQFTVSDTFVPFNAQPRYLDRVKPIEKEAMDPATMYAEAYEGAQLNERNGLVVFQRYCHMYAKGELDYLVAQVERLKIIESGYESGNYYIVAESV